MEFIPFPNTVKLEAIFTQDGQRVMNTHHYIVNEAITAGEMAEIAEAYKDAWALLIAPWVADTVSLVLIKVTRLDSEFAPGIEYSDGLPLVGEAESTAMPNNVTVAVKWTTGFRGRSYRGRTFHVGITENVVTENTVSSGAVVALGTAYGNLMALDYSEGPAIMGIASKFQDNLPRAVGVITPVTAVAVDDTVDSQRRRLPGRGR